MLSDPYATLRINYHGLFQSPMSWAQVNREMAVALDQLGCEVTAVAHRGFCYDPSFPLDPRLKSLRRKAPHKEIDLVFGYPLIYPRLKARFKAGLLVYETTELPPAWVEEIERHLNLLIVPSMFCREFAIQSGVSPERIEVIPYGYNPTLFHPGARPQARFQEDGFVFLCIAMPHIRKGILELIQAFSEEFDLSEPVSLVIKTPYRSRKNGSTRDWEIPRIEEAVKSFGREAISGRRILLISEALPSDEMPDLYASCHAYVQPSYSEGFGLSILEAKAVGRPTVVTGWGGHMDFCTTSNSYLVDYDLRPAGKAQYDHSSSTAYAAMPMNSSLRQQMRMVYKDSKGAQQKVLQSLGHIQNLTWAQAARRLADLLLERV